MDFSAKIAGMMSLPVGNVANAVRLLEQDCTIAFIARYRKEATGCMDEVEIGRIRQELNRLKQMEERRAFVLKSIGEQGGLDGDLKRRIEEAVSLSEIEDLYMPYKPKRKTRAVMAKEKGLEDLAVAIMRERDVDVGSLAERFVNPLKGVVDADNALEGARDIVAEWINEQAVLRQRVRKYFFRNAFVEVGRAKGYKQDSKYAQWVDWRERAAKAPSHRVLALFRAERENELRLSFQVEDEEELKEVVYRTVTRRRDTSCARHKMKAADDCLGRLLLPSLETELRTWMKDRADVVAIDVFSRNLRQLLMSSPLGEKRVLAIDPGYRTGCKVVCLDSHGMLLHHDVIYPFAQMEKAGERLLFLVKKYDIEAVAIGNGTASKEIADFVRSLDFGGDLTVAIVNESGASVYSASELAREELGDYDITVRGAVSIGRRLQDPLAELVKISPESIGVGQYQHDVDQRKLKESLQQTVESCVNQVGVELNTASRELLSYVSGIGPALAGSIIEYRKEHGGFATRRDLLNVRRFGPKAFEQAAGFLRIRHSSNPLDATAVHPERYSLVERMAKDAGCTVEQLIADRDRRDAVVLDRYVGNDCGMPTLRDIMQELEKPMRDVRTKFEQTTFDKGVNTIEELRVGQILDGVVTNITAFGAFVDIGVHQDGLIHISQVSNCYVDDLNSLLHLNQKVRVKLIDLDIARKRISLSMKDVD